IGAPLGRAISTWWVSRWVSTPTTASTSSASMGTGLVPFRWGAGQRSAPTWVEVTERRICDGSRPQADRLLIKPTGGPGRCRQPQQTRHGEGTRRRPDLGRVTPRSPAPSLVVLHPGAPQRHSQILEGEGESIDGVRTTLVRVIRRCFPAPPYRARWPTSWPCSARALPHRHSPLSSACLLV